MAPAPASSLTPTKKRGRNFGPFVWVRDGTQDHPAYILLQPTEEPPEDQIGDVQVQWQQTGHTAWVKQSAIQDASKVERQGRSRKASDTALEAQKNAQEALKKKAVAAAAVAAKSPKKTPAKSPKKTTPAKKAQTVKVKVTPKAPSSAKARRTTTKEAGEQVESATQPVFKSARLQKKNKELKEKPVKKAQHTKVVRKEDTPKKKQLLKKFVESTTVPKSATATAEVSPPQQDDEPSLFQSFAEPLAHAKDAVVSGILGYFKGFMTNKD
jgi:hypothetical protein